MNINVSKRQFIGFEKIESFETDGFEIDD